MDIGLFYAANVGRVIRMVTLKSIGAFIVHFIEGAIIGIGFILPGVSGGALAAIFGLYERIVNFISHITKDFISNLLFFLPIGLGALAGIFAIARPLGFILTRWETWCLWFFIGIIAGTLPKLWREAGSKGRKKIHYAIFILSFIVSLTFFIAIRFLSIELPVNPLTRILSGVMVALGVLVPGIASSVLLIIFGLYKPLLLAFENFDIASLLFVGAGGALCLFSFSFLMSKLLEKAYTGTYHVIFAIVVASTMTILPPYDYTSPAAAYCFIFFAAGAAIGVLLSKMEK
jgi:putative membrane protein